MKTRFYILKYCWLILAVTSCQSSPFPGLTALQDKNAWPDTFNAWYNQCLNEKTDGNFSSSLRTKQLPGLQFEGRWSERFERFQGRIAGPLNQTLANIDLTLQNQNISLSPDISQMQADASNEIHKATEALAVMGPQGLRKMLCGISGFSEPGTKAFASAPQVAQKEYGFLNRIQFEGHRIDITARYQFQTQHQATATVHLKAPVVVETPELNVMWQGTVQPLQPKQIEIEGKDVAVTLMMEEFE